MAEYRIRGRLTEETYTRYQTFAQEQQFSDRNKDEQAVCALLDAYGQSTQTASLLDALGLTAEQVETIHEALAQRGISLAAFVKDAALRRAKAVSNQHEALASGDGGHTRVKAKGSAYVECGRAVQALMEQNARESDITHRLYVTKRHIVKTTGLAPKTVDGYWQEHAEEIEAHNRTMGFQDYAQGRYHNQHVYVPGSNGQVEDTNGTLEEQTA